MAFPSTQDTFSREANEVAGVGGTFTDANKQNAVYALLEQMQLTYGLSGDVASSLGSHTAQIKYLLAGGAGGIVQAPAAPAGPTDGMLWIDNDQSPPGLYRANVPAARWDLVGADAIWIGGRDLDPADVPNDGDAIVWDAANNRFHYAPGAGTVMQNPMTAAGQLISSTTAGVPIAINAGNNNRVLTMVAGQPTWADNQAMFNPMSAAGQLITSTTAGAPAVIDPANENKILTMRGGSPAWFDNQAMFNPMAAAGCLITSTTAGAPIALNPGNNATVLTMVGGGPAWTPIVRGHVIEDEGNPIAARAYLNFLGPGVTATDDAAGDRTNVTISGLVNPMTASGQLIYSGVAGAPQALNAGTNGYVLTMVAGNPAWAAAAAGFSDPMTAVGDLIFRDTGGTTRLGVGSSGYVLTVSGGKPVWAAAATGFADPMTTVGDLIVRDTGGTVRLPIGTANQVLTAISGRPTWSAPITGGHTIQDETVTLPARALLNFVGATVTAADDAANNRTNITVTAMANPMTASGQLIYGGLAGAPQALNVGSNGYILTLASGTPVWAAPPPAGFSDPMTAIGDLIIRNASNVTARLGIGSSAQVLTVTGGVPAWATLPASGMANPMTAAGDLIYGGTPVAGVAAPTRLPIGSDGRVLTMAGGLPTWAVPAVGYTDPLTTTGDLVYRAAGGTARLAVGAANQVLTVSGGVPVWASPASGFADPMTSVGDLIYRNGSNVTARLPVGSAGQVLTMVSGVPAWTAPPATDWALNGNTVGSEQWLGTLTSFALPIRTNNTERLRIYNAFPTTVVKTALGVDDRAYLSASIDGTITCARTGTTVTGTGFAPQHVGRILVWDDGNIGTITAYSSTTQVTTAESGTVASQAATLKSPGFAVSATGDAILGGGNPQSLQSNAPTLELRGGQPDLNKSGGIYWRNWDGTRLAVGHYASTGLFKLGTTSAHDAQLVANDVQKLRLMSGGNVRVHPTAAQDNSFAYNASSLLVTQQTPTATATLNDPQSVLYLAREGTAAQCYGAAAAFRLARWENNGTNSRSRLDLSLAHGAFDVQSNTPMTWLSNGNVGVGTATEFGGGAGVVGLLNRATAPTTNPTGALVLYSEAGVLKYRTTDGSVARLPSPTTVSSAMAYTGSNQTSTGAGNHQKALLNTELWDNNSEFNTSTNRFVATDAGHYLVNAQVYWTSPPAGRIITEIYINSVNFGNASAIMADGVNNQQTVGAILLNLNAGDYVELFFYHSGAGTPTINGGFSQGTYMIVERLD